MTTVELAKPVAAWRKNLGQLIAPETAALLSRSLRTLPARIRQHNENAMAAAEAMEQHPKITKVHYPGLPSFEGHDLAQQQMTGSGGMLSIEVEGGHAAAATVADRLTLFLHATILGGAESLGSQPSAHGHHGLRHEERLKRGIGEGILRLSVGLEDAQDLIAHLNQALKQP